MALQYTRRGVYWSFIQSFIMCVNSITTNIQMVVTGQPHSSLWCACAAWFMVCMRLMVSSSSVCSPRQSSARQRTLLSQLIVGPATVHCLFLYYNMTLFTMMRKSAFKTVVMTLQLCGVVGTQEQGVDLVNLRFLRSPLHKAQLPPLPTDRTREALLCAPPHRQSTHLVFRLASGTNLLDMPQPDIRACTRSPNYYWHSMPLDSLTAISNPPYPSSSSLFTRVRRSTITYCKTQPLMLHMHG
jgi:hypothetical protein